MNFNEGLKRVGSYLIATDAFRRHFEAEDKIKIKETGRSDVLPFELSLTGSTKIYLLRLRDLPKLSTTLISRWTGIDLAIKGSRRLLRK